jgi:hypothetical protein
MSDRAQLAVLFSEIYYGVQNVIEELTACMSIIEATKSGYLYEEAKNVMQSLNIPTQKVAPFLRPGAPCILDRKSSMS